MPEYNFGWGAVLEDGRCISENDGLRFKDIAAEIKDLVLVPLVAGWPTYRQRINPGQRAVWCRRGFATSGVDPGTGQLVDFRIQTHLHIIGFQYTGPDGRNYQSLIYVPDDGSPAIYGPGPFKEDHAVYGWVSVD